MFGGFIGGDEKNGSRSVGTGRTAPVKITRADNVEQTYHKLVDPAAGRQASSAAAVKMSGGAAPVTPEPTEPATTATNEHEPLAQWEEFGFSAEEAAEWREYFDDPEIAAEWRDAEFGPKVAAEWREPMTIELAVWEKGFYQGSEKHTIDIFTKPDEVRPWKQLGFPPSRARAWRLGSSERQKWNGILLSGLEADGFTDPKKAKEWEDADFDDPNDVFTNWLTVSEGDNPDFAPAVLKKWRRAGCGSLDTINDWWWAIEADSPDAIAPYYDLGITDPKKLIDAGLSESRGTVMEADELAKWLKKSFDLDDIACLYFEEGLSLDEAVAYRDEE